MKDIGTIELFTKNLILRKFKIEDSEGMYNNWATDPNTNKYLSWELHKNIEETKEVVSKWIESYESGSYHWIVELKDTHEVIGSINAVHVRKNDLNVEIGYCYGSKFWGNGYGTEALRRVIEFFIEDCGLYLVEARHISGNPASGRVMEKAGMEYVATLPKWMINKEGKREDLKYYATRKQ